MLVLRQVGLQGWLAGAYQHSGRSVLSWAVSEAFAQGQGGWPEGGDGSCGLVGHEGSMGCLQGMAASGLGLGCLAGVARRKLLDGYLVAGMRPFLFYVLGAVLSLVVWPEAVHAADQMDRPPVTQELVRLFQPGSFGLQQALELRQLADGLRRRRARIALRRLADALQTALVLDAFSAEAQAQEVVSQVATVCRGLDLDATEVGAASQGAGARSAANTRFARRLPKNPRRLAKVLRPLVTTIRTRLLPGLVRYCHEQGGFRRHAAEALHNLAAALQGDGALALGAWLDALAAALREGRDREVARVLGSLAAAAQDEGAAHAAVVEAVLTRLGLFRQAYPNLFKSAVAKIPAPQVAQVLQGSDAQVRAALQGFSFLDTLVYSAAILDMVLYSLAGVCATLPASYLRDLARGLGQVPGGQALGVGLQVVAERPGDSGVLAQALAAAPYGLFRQCADPSAQMRGVLWGVLRAPEDAAVDRVLQTLVAALGEDEQAGAEAAVAVAVARCAVMLGKGLRGGWIEQVAHPGLQKALRSGQEGRVASVLQGLAPLSALVHSAVLLDVVVYAVVAHLAAWPAAYLHALAGTFDTPRGRAVGRALDAWATCRGNADARHALAQAPAAAPLDCFRGCVDPWAQVRAMLLGSGAQPPGSSPALALVDTLCQGLEAYPDFLELLTLLLEALVVYRGSQERLHLLQLCYLLTVCGPAPGLPCSLEALPGAAASTQLGLLVVRLSPLRFLGTFLQRHGTLLR